MAKDQLAFTLRQDLETALQRYLTEGHRVIIETVSQFFDPKSVNLKRRTDQPKTERRKTGRRLARRNGDEINDIGEKILQVLRTSPGVSAAEVASKLGLDKAMLLAPMLQLRAQGKIRKVGERAATRYFPSTDRHNSAN